MLHWRGNWVLLSCILIGPHFDIRIITVGSVAPRALSRLCMTDFGVWYPSTPRLAPVNSCISRVSVDSLCVREGCLSRVSACWVTKCALPTLLSGAFLGVHVFVYLLQELCLGGSSSGLGDVVLLIRYILASSVAVVLDGGCGALGPLLELRLRH